jgi:hypothetical protein
MSYKETLFFVGKCLTINHEEHNKSIVESKLKSNDINWESVVKVSTGHFVFPALYCNLKKANFLHYLPSDLVNYMEHITDLNRKRNQQIIIEAKEINDLLLANNITPIFLKGTGNLLEGLYGDIAERMVGDIDFIVSLSDYRKTIELLKKDGYNQNKKSDLERTFHWHYPKITKNNRIGAVEIHKMILQKNLNDLLHFNDLQKRRIKKSNFYFLSNGDKILNAILPKILNDKLYHSKNIPLRTMYDVFLISTQNKYSINLSNKKILKKFNDFCGCIKLTLGNPESILVEENQDQKTYLDSYIKIIDNSKKEIQKYKFNNFIEKLKGKFIIFKLSFFDEEYRNYSKKRLLQLSFYKEIFGINSKPNP